MIQLTRKIYLSPSDQIANRYAYGNTTEAIQCQKISDACETALKRCGFKVKNSKTPEISKRVLESNSWVPDLHVCIHTNAHNGRTTGTRIYCYNSSGKGFKAAKDIYSVLAPLTPGTSENVKTNPGLYEIKKTKSQCVYIEVDFHDVPAIAEWIISHTEEIGEAIAEGICKHFGVKYMTSSRTLYRVQVGAYSNKFNADSVLIKLKKAGFDGHIVQDK